MEAYAVNKKVKLGFAPTRRFITNPKYFNKDAAVAVKNKIEAKIRGYDIEIVNLDFLNEEGLLFDGADTEKVLRKFREAEVDALFIPHTNFGNEEPSAKLARDLGKPTLLWGPRDEMPDADGARYTDSQCGLFATSKVLKMMRVPFSYITNCALDDEIFDRGFKNFIGAASVVKHFRNLRIGQMGTRPGAFWTVKSNETELLSKFGIEVVPVTMTEFQIMIKEAKDHPMTVEKSEDFRKRFPNTGFSRDDFDNLAALYSAFRLWAERNNLSAIAAQCWKPLDLISGVSGCFIFGELTGDLLPVACESDIHGAISSVMVAAANLWKEPTFLADLTIRNPQDDNSELLWHCGVFPDKLAKPGGKINLGSHQNRLNPGVGLWELRHDPLTIARFDGVDGEYSMLMGHAQGAPGPFTGGTYVWAKVKDWPLWEHKVIYGPYIHHCVGAYGNFAPVLFEACRFIPGLTPDPVEPTKEEIEKFLRG